ncbi:MAG: hypothetical protein OD817_04520 [Gammaproteobacteria bacterium]
MKNMFIRAVPFVAAAWLAVPVAVADMCQPYAGKTVEPTTYEIVEKLLSERPLVKGEFETTAEFNEKTAKFISALPENFLIGYALHKSPIYDADTQQMRVFDFHLVGNEKRHFIFGYGSLTRDELEDMAQLFKVRYAVKTPKAKSKVGRAIEKNAMKRKFLDRNDVLDVLVSKTWERTGSYPASNVLGASVTVKTYKMKIQMIFERESGAYTFADELHPIPMTVDQAKRMKKSLKATVLAAPKPPYFEKNFGKIEPTFDDLNEVDEEISVIIANIQCVFLLDRKNKVLAAFAIK